MTSAQEKAIIQIRDIVREHFEGSVVIVSGTAIGTDDSGQLREDTSADIEYIFHGGYAQAIGLIELARLHVWRRNADQSTNGAPE